VGGEGGQDGIGSGTVRPRGEGGRTGKSCAPLVSSGIGFLGP
jgi:hypothetical protein